MRAFFFFATAFYLFGCSAAKNPSNRQGPAINFDNLSLSIDQTGIIGKIVRVDKHDDSISIDVLIQKSKSGGAGSKLPENNSNETFIIHPKFERRFDSDAEVRLRDQLEEGKGILMAIQFDALENGYTIQYLKIQ